MSRLPLDSFAEKHAQWTTKPDRVPTTDPDSTYAPKGGTPARLGYYGLQPGEWQGPVRSSYGLHLVRITRYEPAHPPRLDEVRTQVVTDFKNERLQTAAENYYARLHQKYRIEINNAAMASALANADSNASTKRRVETNAPDVD